MSDKYTDSVLDLKFEHVERSVEQAKTNLTDHMDTQFEAKMAVLNELAKDVVETKEQAKKTNGRVTMLEKLIWTALGALPLLTIWAAWLSNQVLANQQTITSLQTSASVELQAAVANGIKEALEEYNK